MVRKRYKSNQEKYETYRITVSNWEHSYSFGTNRNYRRDGPYSEYCLTVIKGPLITPVLQKISAVELTINGDVSLNQTDDSEPPPNAVGHLYTVRGNTILYGYLRIPQRYLPALTGLLTADKVKMVELYGFQLKRGKALIVNVEFATHLRSDYE